MITGAIFDMDGTLLDSLSIWDDAGALYLKTLGIEAEPGLGRRLFPMSMEEGAAYLRSKYGLHTTKEQIMQGVNAVIAEFYQNSAPLKPHVKSFLDQMQENKIRMAVATSSDLELAEAAFQRLDVLRYFTAILTCTQVGAGKTKPDTYYKAAEALQTDVRDTWVFEDALYAARTAKSAGFRVAGVYDAFGERDWEELQELSDYAMRGFTDFAEFYRAACKEECI